nr:hypothetical protein [uncultured Flavobacterium sp.]
MKNIFTVLIAVTSFAYTQAQDGKNGSIQKQPSTMTPVVELNIRCGNAANAAVNTLREFGIENTMQDNGLTTYQNLYLATYTGCMNPKK